MLCHIFLSFLNSEVTDFFWLSLLIRLWVRLAIKARAKSYKFFYMQMHGVFTDKLFLTNGKFSFFLPN